MIFETLLDGKSMTGNFISNLSGRVVKHTETYPLEPVKRKLLGRSRRNALQKSSRSLSEKGLSSL